MASTSAPKLYVRTTVRLRAALKRLVTDLSETSAFARRRRMLSQEVIVNASWLMLRDMDPEKLAAELAPYVKQAEAMLDDEPDLANATPAPAEPQQLPAAGPRRMPKMGHSVPPAKGKEKAG